MLQSGSKEASGGDANPRSGDPKVVTVVGPNDVQLGRGRPVVTSEGNQRFRRLVLDNRTAYMSSARHAHKGAIARQILQTIQQRGRNVLRKLDSASEWQALGLSTDDQAWVVVDEKTSLLKVKQALREQERSAFKSDINPSSTPSRTRCNTSKAQVAIASNRVILPVAAAKPGQVGTSLMSKETPPSIGLVKKAEALSKETPPSIGLVKKAEAPDSAVITPSQCARPEKSRRETESIHSAMEPTPPPPDALQLLFQLKHSKPKPERTEAVVCAPPQNRLAVTQE
jgi:hypothetical protein